MTANAFAAAVTPSSLAWNSAPRRRSGRYASGARISANRPTSSVMSPTASRRPMPTATSATESVASSSSTSADRKATRSVAMVVVRYASVTPRRIATCDPARP